MNLSRLSVFLLLALLAACASTSPETEAALASVSSTDTSQVEQSLAALEGQPRALSLPRQSCVQWVGKKKSGEHDGGFETCTGRVFLSEGGELLKLEIAVDAASIFSDSFILTGHLKSEDFFEVNTYPLANFVSTDITPLGQDRYQITGDFDVHGVVHAKTFEATARANGTQWSGEATMTFIRSDHDISYVDKGEEDPIADEVPLTITLSTTPSE